MIRVIRDNLKTGSYDINMTNFNYLHTFFDKIRNDLQPYQKCILPSIRSLYRTPCDKIYSNSKANKVS